MAVTETNIAVVDQADKKSVEEKNALSAKAVDVETVEEPTKTYYSTLSVWLMILFSGLAIGSDGT